MWVQERVHGQHWSTIVALGFLISLSSPSEDPTITKASYRESSSPLVATSEWDSAGDFVAMVIYLLWSSKPYTIVLGPKRLGVLCWKSHRKIHGSWFSSIAESTSRSIARSPKRRATRCPSVADDRAASGERPWNFSIAKSKDIND